MASITIRKLDDALKSRLRVSAARHSRSMEEEARAILKAGLSSKPEPKRNLAEAIRQRIAPLGGIEIALPVREPVRRPPKLSE